MTPNAFSRGYEPLEESLELTCNELLDTCDSQTHIKTQWTYFNKY